MSVEEKIVDKIVKEAGIGKTAKVFDVGDIVVAYDQVQGLNRGSLYKVLKNAVPGKITIAELPVVDGAGKTEVGEQQIGPEVGEFAVDRFVRWHNQY
ncbi:MAG: hypothetical protein Q7R33_02020 [Nitrosarchaeum sp.]|nr:hypothetical protein [Nitrosarchaeum sp.]